MAQTYSTIPSTQSLANSRQIILDRDDAAASCFSGTAFPSTNLLLGMVCYRTDQLKLYQLTALPVAGGDAANWVLVYDLSTGVMVAPNASAVPWSGVSGKPTTVAGYGITDALLSSGGSATGKISFVASTTTSASVTVPHGASPSAPANGDVWSTTTAFFVRINGATRTVSVLEAAETYSAKKTFDTSSAAGASLNIPAGVAPTAPANGDMWATTTQLVYRLNGVSRNIAFWNANSLIDVGNGGTGASNAADARANLGVAKLGVVAAIVNKPSSFTLAAGDQGKLLHYDNAAAGTCTIPTDATWNADLGTFINFTQLGAGQLQFVGAAGVAIRTANGYTRTVTQHSVATLVKVDANVWLLGGDLTA